MTVKAIDCKCCSARISEGLNKLEPDSGASNRATHTTSLQVVLKYHLGQLESCEPGKMNIDAEIPPYTKLTRNGSLMYI